ncbi:MAG: hypothetical protein Kow0092_27010 [Deferrisomatales bacterium]
MTIGAGPRGWALALALGVGALGALGHAAGPGRDPKDGLARLARAYETFQAATARSPLGIPLAVHADPDGEVLAAEAEGWMEAPFAELAQALSRPSDWCEFVPLNPNVKACTCWAPRGEGSLLRVFVGRKVYQDPERVYRLEYAFQVARREAGYLRVVLTAPRGPLGTSDYRLELEAMPAGAGSFMRFRSSHRSSRWSRAATGLYLATLGRNKVGFTVAGQDPSGRPVYVRGVQGILERNVVRYYLALGVYLAARRLPPEERFEACLRGWFEAAERYPRQLRELSEQEYLDAKRRERRRQQELQLGAQAR